MQTWLASNSQRPSGPQPQVLIQASPWKQRLLFQSLKTGNHKVLNHYMPNISQQTYDWISIKCRGEKKKKDVPTRSILNGCITVTVSLESEEFERSEFTSESSTA